MTTAAWRAEAYAHERRLDLKDWAILGAALAMVLVFSQGWIAFITKNGVDQADSGLIRTLFLPAYALGIGVMALSPWDALKAVIRQPFLIALMVIVALSTLWSISPDQTARRVFAVTCTTLCGVVLASRFRWARLAEIFAAGFAILAVVSVLVVFLMPSIGKMTELFPGAWRGLWPEKNALGGNMAIGFAVAGAAMFLNPRRALIWGGVALGCLALVLASTSKTSLLAAMLGAAGVGFVWLVRRGPLSGVAATWAAVAGVAAIAAIGILAADVVFDFLGKDATLTGRTKIWSAALRQIARRPWLGYGYSAVWTDTSNWGPIMWITKDAGFRAQHAHNAWIEQWLGLGIGGLAAWALFFGQTLTAAIIAVYRNPGAYLAFPFLLVYALTSMTESIAVTYNDLRWVMFVALAVKLAWPDSRCPPD